VHSCCLATCYNFTVTPPPPKEKELKETLARGATSVSIKQGLAARDSWACQRWLTQGFIARVNLHRICRDSTVDSIGCITYGLLDPSCNGIACFKVRSLAD